MTPSDLFHLDYDSDADVLYLGLEDEPAQKAVEDQYGLIWRYGRDASLIGITIVNFRDFWGARRALLAQQFAVPFMLSEREAVSMLDGLFLRTER